MILVGILFLLVGALGFVPAVNTQFEGLRFAGHHSETVLLGGVQLNTADDWLHLGLGVGMLVLGWLGRPPRR
nr:DUF4383 domain-containing protein [Amycolatopsis anabasis]